MKKSTLIMAAMLSTASVNADEGMWMLYNLPQAVYGQMQAEGFSMPYDAIYNNDDAIKNVVVNFSGYCSGVVVSPDGLVFTNHHCGFEAIRSHSTVEHDYMLNGFYAKTYEEELPNKDLFVSFMVEQKDVTDELRKLGMSSLPIGKVGEWVDSVENAWQKDIRQKDSTLRVEIKPFYEGNKYYMTTYRDFTDVRLVFSVPKSMGKFGGETDNWMWPRQTCDYSVFHIYADPKTNGPAAYSKDNVPYHPKRWAQVSLQGYKDGDYAMTMGYPGSTERYLSSYGIQTMRDAENAPRAQVRGVKQEVMQKHMRANEAVRIKYDSKYAQSSNYWKNSIGMNKCIDSIGIVNMKREYETRLRAWQDTAKAANDLAHKVDFDKLAKLYKESTDVTYAWTNFAETFTRRSNVELNTRAFKLQNGMEVKGSEKNKKKQYHEFEDNSDEWDMALDKEVLATLLKNYKEHVDAKWLPKFYNIIDTQFGGDYTKYVDYLWEKSLLMK